MWETEETVEEPHLFQRIGTGPEPVEEAPVEMWDCYTVWLSASKLWLAQVLEGEDPR